MIDDGLDTYFLCSFLWTSGNWQKTNWPNVFERNDHLSLSLTHMHNISAPPSMGARALHKIRAVLVRHDAASRIKRVPDRIVQQITDVRRIDVGEAEQTAREVRRIVVRAEYASELLVEHALCLVAQPIAFLVPAGESDACLRCRVVLVVLDQLREHLQPVGVALELGVI